MKLTSLSVAATVIMALAACNSKTSTQANSGATEADQAAEFAVTGAELSLPPVDGRPAAAYFTMSGGSKKRQLLKVEVPGAENTVLHETITKDGVSSMQAAGDIIIGAGETVTFERGGKHVMVFGLDQQGVGETVTLTLSFDTGEPVQVEAKTVRIGTSEQAGENDE